jgi:hypothetical protein
VADPRRQLGAPAAGRLPLQHRRCGLAAVAMGGNAIKCPSPLNVPKDTCDHSCYLARSDEYPHLMTPPPTARLSGWNATHEHGTKGWNTRNATHGPKVHSLTATPGEHSHGRRSHCRAALFVFLHGQRIANLTKNYHARKIRGAWKTMAWWPEARQVPDDGRRGRGEGCVLRGRAPVRARAANL